MHESARLIGIAQHEKRDGGECVRVQSPLTGITFFVVRDSLFKMFSSVNVFCSPKQRLSENSVCRAERCSVTCAFCCQEHAFCKLSCTFELPTSKQGCYVHCLSELKAFLFKFCC